MTGFVMSIGNKDYFMESKAAKRTDKVCAAFIERIGMEKGKSRDFIDRAKTHKPTLDDIRRRIDAATLSKLTTQNGFEYYRISGKNFSFNYPHEDFNNDVIVF